MREIKFRAWVMNDYDGHGLVDYMEDDAGTFNDPFEAHKNGEIVLMQYTGLKDKNGVEIYEGDVFKATHNFGPGGMHERISSVAFDLEKGYQWEYWDLDTIEVIGNIYEHPHLLEASE